MKTWKYGFLSGIALLVALSPSFVWAAGGRIEALQMPAWLQRNGTMQALKPGTELQSTDVVVTGKQARILIRLDEGSLVKLGENGRLDLANLKPAQEQGVFQAVLNVIKGAFRFTTTSIGKNRPRSVDVRIGSLTAGIRGTDIWGSSQIDKDILCLIEGNISVQRGNDPQFSMADPLSFYIAPKDKPAEPVQPVPEEQLAKWAQETELQTGGGVISVDGRWTVNLMSLAVDQATVSIRERLDQAGYATEKQEVQVNGQTWFRVRVSGFSSRQDAQSFARAIDGQYGISQPWIARF
jgi:hypothetical protein